jgi:hypothetical protein
MLTNLTLGTVLIVSLLACLSLSGWTIIFRRLRDLRHTVHTSPPDDAITSAEFLEDVPALCDIDVGTAHDRLLLRAIAFRDELRIPEELGGSRLPGAGLRATDMEALQLSLERIAGEERARLTEGVSWLAVVATVAPLLGLLGTVTGVMGTFMGIQAAGAANIAAIAPGVSEALITTVVGLVVAIPAAVAHQMLSARADAAEESLAWFSAELVAVVTREMRR